MATWKEKYNKKYGFEKSKSHSLSAISKKTGVSKKGLQQIYNKGIGAWKTNLPSVRVKGSFKKNPNTKKFPRSKRLGKEQWAMARVYSAVMGGKASKVDAKELKMKKGGRTSNFNREEFYREYYQRLTPEGFVVDRKKDKIVIDMDKGGELSDKIKILMKEGYPQKQAVAIAYDMQEKGKLQKGGNLDKVIGGIPYRIEGSEAIISTYLPDDTKERIIKRAEVNGYDASPNMGGGVTIFLKKFEKGGETDFNPDGQIKDKVVHNSGDVGGMLVGKRHSEGGIKAINKSTGQPLEMEGGEVVITRKAVSDPKKRSFNGKMMTNREILSTINESGGGVSFADGGELPNDIGINCDAQFEYGGKMMCGKDLVMAMGGTVTTAIVTDPNEAMADLQSTYGFKDVFKTGGSLKKEFKFDINFIIYVPSTTDVGTTISQSELDKRVNEVKSFVATEFGGYTETASDGGYKSQSGEIVEEEIVKVSVFSSAKNWNENEDVVINQVKKWANEWGQEAIGFEYEGDLYYIDNEGKFAKGGDINDEDIFDDAREELGREYLDNLDRFDEGGELDEETQFKIDFLNQKIKELRKKYNIKKSTLSDLEKGIELRNIRKYENAIDEIKLEQRTFEQIVEEIIASSSVEFGQTPKRKLTKNKSINGETSQLTKEEQKTVKSESFIDWFGDWELAYETNNYEGVSKVINAETKEPLVVYHGTNKKFVSWETYKENNIHYFAKKLAFAEWFSEYSSQRTDTANVKAKQIKDDNFTDGKFVYNCFLDIKNPVDFSPFGIKTTPMNKLLEYVEVKYGLNLDAIPNYEFYRKSTNKVYAWRLIRQWQDFNLFVRNRTPYDGFVFYEFIPESPQKTFEDASLCFTAFYSNQIKFVNNKSFSKEALDSRLEIGGLIF